jgi:Na+-translocating ferredoxin:NAD+ oxidoreductase RnfG subunit
MTMSKPAIRIALFLLISLTLIAATYMTVQGAIKTEVNRAQAHVVNGLQTDLNHDRLSSVELQSLQMNTYSQPGGSHHSGGCHSDSQQVPQD